MKSPWGTWVISVKKNSIARVTPKRLRRKPKREGCFTCRDGKSYARQQAKNNDP